MTDEEIRERVRKIISKVTNIAPERIGDGTDLREDLQIDSLSLLEIGIDVDYEFQLHFAELEEQLAGLRTLEDAVSLVRKILEDRALPASEG